MTSMFWATSAASILGFAYVGSIYVWRSEYDRDHPETIKRRFLSAFFTSCLCPPLVYVFGNAKLLEQHGLAAVIGVRTEGLIAASVIPLALTMVLFLGPIAMLVSNERFRWLMHPLYWSQSLTDLVWWRNHVVAPFTEELAFRACMVPILLGYYSPHGAVIMSPLFFGIAHFHHMIERIRRGQDFKTAFFISSFQFAYTTVFGMYSAFLFVRTGHLASCVIVHGFCNFMGFPDLVQLMHQEPKKKRWVLSAFFCLGLSLFFWALMPTTEENLYMNDIYVWTNSTLFSANTPPIVNST